MIARIVDGAWYWLDRARALGREVGALPLLAVAVAVLAAGGGAVWLLGGGDDDSDRGGAALIEQGSPRLEHEEPADTDRARRAPNRGRGGEPQEADRAAARPGEHRAGALGEPGESRPQTEKQQGEDGKQQGEDGSLLDAAVDADLQEDTGGQGASEAPQLLDPDRGNDQQPDDEPQPGLLDLGG